MSKKNISIDVDLNDSNIPTSIEWKADDLDSADSIECRAMILSLWDHSKKDTLRLDLWTEKMTVDEMKIFFHQTLTSMAETLERSIADERIAGDMRDFCAHFAEKMEISE
jgi:gliding motility-associated protein GldC